MHALTTHPTPRSTVLRTVVNIVNQIAVQAGVTHQLRVVWCTAVVEVLVQLCGVQCSITLCETKVCFRGRQWEWLGWGCATMLCDLKGSHHAMFALQRCQ